MSKYIEKITYCLNILCKFIWLSCTSTQFYNDVYHKFKGFGFKYLLCLSTISALISTIYFINIAAELQNYFHTKIPTDKTKILDQILTSIPDMQYSNGEMDAQPNEPFIVKNNKGQAIILIDTQNKADKKDRARADILITNKNFILKPSLNNNLEKTQILNIKHSDIFKTNATTINQNNVHGFFENIVSSANRGFIYIFFPMLSLFIFVNSILSKLILMIILGIVAVIKSNSPPIKNLVRVTIFSCGPFALLYLPLNLYLPFLVGAFKFFQFIITIIMIIGITKPSNRSNLF